MIFNELAPSGIDRLSPSKTKQKNPSTWDTGYSLGYASNIVERGRAGTASTRMLVGCGSSREANERRGGYEGGKKRRRLVHRKVF